MSASFQVKVRICRMNQKLQAGNNNYVTGTTYAMSSEGLQKAVEVLRKQQDANGDNLALRPKILLVPPELEETGRELLSSSTLIVSDGSSQKVRGSRNVFYNLLDLVVSPYLSDSSMTNYSTTGYYVLSDPADTPTFGIAFLNGQEQPIVEDAPLQADVLGRAWCCYFDFGVAQVDHRAGVLFDGRGREARGAAERGVRCAHGISPNRGDDWGLDAVTASGRLTVSESGTNVENIR